MGKRIFFLILAFSMIYLIGEAFAEPSPSLVPAVSANKIFDRMEKQSENIDALMARVEISNDTLKSQMTLSIKSPDKFAIEFNDGSIQIFFNGQKLWIYIKIVNEVFYHFSDSRKLYFYNFSWFNPRKIFTSLTKETLFTLFDIRTIKSEIASDSILYHTLEFLPVMETVFKEFFDVGRYHMIFSEKSFFPVAITEFDTNDKEKGCLRVLEYKLNDDLADSYFEFEAPPNAVMVPITVVLSQKLKQSALTVYEKLGTTIGNIKRKLLDW